MNDYNANNERIKHRYFTYLKEAMRYNETTVDKVAKALSRFETYSGYRDFKQFNADSAVRFKKDLAKKTGQRSGERLSKSTLNSTLYDLKRFFHWLADQPGYKSRLNYTDSEYFNLSEKESRIARAKRHNPVPTLEQICHAIDGMPCETEIERRNRAVVAFTVLTGLRDQAIASLKLKHVDTARRCVYQDAREVDTKFSKTFTSYFFPVGARIEQIVVDWVSYLRETKLWGHNDPLFPATCVAPGNNHEFGAAGVKREHWRTASPIRAIFKTAFEHAGLPYFNPHSFRNTLVQIGERRCRSPEEFKAWSQNLGHEKVLTTFNSYGEVPTMRQGDLMRAFDEETVGEGLDDKEVWKKLKKLLSEQPDNAIDNETS